MRHRFSGNIFTPTSPPGPGVWANFIRETDRKSYTEFIENLWLSLLFVYRKVALNALPCFPFVRWRFDKRAWRFEAVETQGVKFGYSSVGHRETADIR